MIIEMKLIFPYVLADIQDKVVSVELALRSLLVLPDKGIDHE
jgi:hypothetical protein